MLAFQKRVKVTNILIKHISNFYYISALSYAASSVN